MNKVKWVGWLVGWKEVEVDRRVRSGDMAKENSQTRQPTQLNFQQIARYCKILRLPQAMPAVVFQLFHKSAGWISFADITVVVVVFDNIVWKSTSKAERQLLPKDFNEIGWNCLSLQHPVLQNII